MSKSLSSDIRDINIFSKFGSFFLFLWCILFTVWTSCFFKILFIFYWRIIALQNFVVFCQTSTLISHAAAVKSLQSCPTLWDPIDGSLPGSPVPGILQARTLEWVAISFSNAWKGKVKVKSLSHVPPSATSWTAAHQAPPSMGFSRQEYWSGMPLECTTIRKRGNVTCRRGYGKILNPTSNQMNAD